MKTFREIVALVLMLIGLSLAAYYDGFHVGSLKCDERSYKTCYPAFVELLQQKNKLSQIEDDYIKVITLRPKLKPSGFMYRGDREMWRKKLRCGIVGIFGLLLFVDTRLFWSKRHKSDKNSEQ